MNCSPELVLRVNEIFHDLEGELYENNHAEIFDGEVRRWRRVLRQFLSRGVLPMRLLDIGSGTGFVPLQLKNVLKAEDTLICSDLSAGMLAVCRRRLEQAQMSCRLEFVKLSGEDIPGDLRSLDVITMNSVLHHVPDTSALCRRLDSLLKPGGYLIIGHEPNQRFARNSFLTGNYRFVGNVLRRLDRQPKPKAALKAEGTLSNYEQINALLNERLLKLCLVDQPLSMDEIWTITDVHDHLKGAQHQADLGFDIHRLIAASLPSFKIRYLETYSHLSSHTMKSGLTRIYDGVLRMLFPRSGATFFAVLQKKEESI